MCNLAKKMFARIMFTDYHLKNKIMFKEAIEKKIAELKIRRSKIADDLGLQRSEISSYLNGNRKLSVEKIELVLSYLGAKIV